MIGCGAIAEQHLRAVATLPEVELVGLCDLSPVTVEWMAGRFGTAAFTDHRELLSRELDVVHVLTPPSSHDALARAALDAGAHVVVEKPMTADAAATAALLAHARERDRLATEHQNYRCNDGTRRLVELVSSGRLGRIVEIEVRLALDVTADDRFANPSLPSPVAHLRGGVIRDFLPHQCGLALELADAAGAGDEVLVDHARWGLRSGIAALGCDELRADARIGDIDVVLAFSAATRPDGFRLTVRGTGGTAEVDLFQPYASTEVPRGPRALSPLLSLVANGTGHLRDAAVGLGSKVLQVGPYHGVPRFLAAFYAATRGDGPPPIDDAQILATARFVDALAVAAPEPAGRP